MQLLVRRAVASAMALARPQQQQMLRRDFHTSALLMAGHSHWANIKHKKAIADVKKAAINSKVAKEIAIAVRNGGASVETNLRLRVALDRARQFNLTRTTIDNAIKNGLGGSDQTLEQVTYEGFGPGGVMLLVQALTDNRNRTIQFVRKAIIDCEGSFGSQGTVSWNFENKGILVYENVEDDAAQEKLFDVLSENGGEDLQYDEAKAAKVVCAPEDLHKLKVAIQQHLRREPASMDLVMLAKEKQDVDLDSEQGKMLLKLLDKLDDDPDVQTMYTNCPQLQA